MITRAFLYQKNIAKNEHILIIQNKKYVDVWSIDTVAKTAKRHHPKTTGATIRAMLPYFLGAYKRLELGELNGYLRQATAQALDSMRPRRVLVKA